MKKVNSYFFSDNENNLWNIKLKNNGDMVYSSMYSENKWTREMKIDNKVLDFSVDIDDKQQIHIVYKKQGEIKYCIWNRENWMGKLLYSFGNHEVMNLKIFADLNDINVFFVLIESDESSLAKIVHYSFGIEQEKNTNNFNIVYSVLVRNNFESYYEVERFDENSFCIFIKSYSESKINIIFSKYSNNKWTNGKKLYSLKGDEIKLYSAKLQNQIHVLNLYKENQHYIIEDIFFEPDKKFKHLRVYKGDEKIDDVLIMIKESIMYAIWNEKNNILSSCFKEVWSSALNIEVNCEKELFLYKSIYLYLNKSKIQGDYVIGDRDIKFIVPKDKEEENMFNDLKSKVYEDKLYEEKKIIRNLQDTVNFLDVEVKRKETACETLKDKLNSTINKNKELDDRYSRLKKSYDELQNEVITFKERFEKVKLDKEKLIKDLKDALNEKNFNLDESNKKLKELKNELSEKDINKENTIKNLKEVINEKTAILSDTNDNLNKLKNDLIQKNMDKEKVINDLKEVINEKNNALKKLNEQLNQLKNNLIQGSIDKETTIKDLKISIEEKNFNLSELNKKLVDLEKTLINTNNELNNVKKDKDILIQNFNKKNEENKNIQIALNKALNEKKEFNMELINLSKEQEEVLKYLDVLIKDRDNTKNELQNATRQLNLINNEKNELANMLEKVNKEKDDLKKELNMESNKSILSKILNWRE